MTEANLFEAATDPDFDAIGDAHQQIAATTARFWQTFVRDADDFTAADTARNRHAHHRASQSAHHFRAALRRALGFDFQIAAQIGTARFETEVRLRLHAQLHEAAKSLVTRDLEARARRSFRRHDEFVNFRAVRIGRIVDADFARRAA